MRYLAIGLVGGFFASVGLSEALEFRTHFDGKGMSRISVINVPAREPVAALHARLHFRAAAGLSAVTVTAPDQGAWSQVQPRCTRVGDVLDLWLMAPAMGESRDSSEKEMAALALTITGGAGITAAGELIDSVEILEALGPDGRKLSPSKNLTTSVRSFADSGQKFHRSGHWIQIGAQRRWPSGKVSMGGSNAQLLGGAAFRRDSPLRGRSMAPRNRRSQMASAKVGSANAV